MKFFQYITTLLLLVFGLSSVCAAVIPTGSKDGSEIAVEVINIYRDNQELVTTLQLDFSKINLKSNVEVVITPKYIGENDSVSLEPVTVAGRNRWYWIERNRVASGLIVKGFGKDKGEMINATPNEPIATAYTPQVQNTRLKTYNVTLFTPYRNWMENAIFEIETEVRGCANCIKGKQGEDFPLAKTDFVQRTFFPEFLYVAPVAEAVKMREISARAYIDFPVNQVEIYPDYRRNPAELAKIRATIDSVRNDKDINITSLHISGTASPEGSYQNNVRLASGRTEALKNYVQGLYSFPSNFITTSFEPVDWAGLSEFLSTVVYSGTVSVNDSIRFDQFQNIPGDIDQWKESIPSASAILSIVNSDLEPVARNNKIKNTYPKEYAWLLENVYPALRHSDYRIQFEIKTYTEVSEIIEVMQTRPQNLSLAELFVAANSQEFGSPLYDQAFDLAVTMYPDDETANLNAGINAMRRGDIISAERYLPKAGQTPEAEYARALLLLKQGDEETAVNILSSLQGSLSPQVASAARAAVQGLEKTADANAKTFVLIE
ncbi:MAG: hypothetical protein J1F16_09085 [Muribaculaceae bacterium]|nr:hypothetical protein [Muribaculaceae bacterium]